VPSAVAQWFSSMRYMEKLRGKEWVTTPAKAARVPTR